MKDYKDVVNERFDEGNDETSSVYAENHPIGKYLREVLYGGIDQFISCILKEDLSKMRILDIGCGNGGMLSYFIEKGFSADKVIGIDLSLTRIENAEIKYPDLMFYCDNAINFKLENQKFDLITSFDLFSHFSSREDIINGIKNVSDHLAEDGLFLWYDIYSKDHFSPNRGVDSWGFNVKQMISIANESGFELVYKKTFFKLFFNKYHSVYQAKRFPLKLIKLAEIVLPGSPGNLLIVFKKK